MIGRLIAFCIRNRLLVLLLAFVVFGAGIYSIYAIKLDAIPDLSDVQVIIYTDYPGQAPQVVEDQVTYPLTTAMLAVPYAKVVRGYSFFGLSFVYVIFEDGTDLYWARSRVLEYLNFARGRLPPGVTPSLGPDATGVGWVYEYSLANGYYCPNHPQGMWHDVARDHWYAHKQDAPVRRRRLLRHVRIFDEPGTCPLDGKTKLELAQFDLSELRSFQDWYLRYELTAVPGVSEVASIGGFVRQYQVVVDPDKLLAYHIPITKVRMAIKRSNNDVGGRLLEQSETEYMVRGRGYLGQLSDAQREEAAKQGIPLSRVRKERVLEDLRRVPLGATSSGTPILLGDVATVQVGPELRRGLAERNGKGEVAGGIVVMRSGENALEVIQRVKLKIQELEKGLPPGVTVRPDYDRSDLIERAVDTLKEKLLEEMLVVALVCVIFLLHVRSALVAVFVLPMGVLASLTIMNVLGINANIMSLGGIAIAIGVMVDSSIIMVENAHNHYERAARHYERESGQSTHQDIITRAAQEVGPSLFFSLLVITVSFFPVFVLGEQSGRLFKPLAYTKTFAMATAAFLAVTVIPVLMVFFVRRRTLPASFTAGRTLRLIAVCAGLPVLGLAAWALFAPKDLTSATTLWLTDHWLWVGAAFVVGALLLLLPQRILPENRNPISHLLIRLYEFPFWLAMRGKWLTLGIAVALILSMIYPWSHLGSEFMPPLEEGDLLYMPTTDPGVSITKARQLLQQTDKLIASFPEVENVFGKVGRSETATDPAPLSMIETTITLWRDKSKWRTRTVPGILGIGTVTRPITIDELTYGWHDPDGTHHDGLNDVVRFPGLTNAWTMPIKTRIDMLSTGIKTPVGIKIMGENLTTLASLAQDIASQVRTIPGTVSAYPEKTVGGNYVDFDIDREESARYGLTVGDVQDVIMSAMGGMNITTTVEGLERYPVNLRYLRELRDSLPALKRTLVPTPGGAQVPLAQLAKIRIHRGPPAIKSENARKTAWIYVDLSTSDIGGWVDQAKQVVAQHVEMPPGYTLQWSGQYEYMQAAAKRLRLVIPITLLVIVLLLYTSTRSVFRTLVVLLAVPFSLVGAIWFLYFSGYNMSLAVWVGLIALAGLDAETGVVMLLYLDTSYERFRREGRMRNKKDLRAAIHDGAVKRIRPKTMTVATTTIGLLPIMFGTSTGSDVMKRMAAPMVGGLVTSFVMELLIYPVIFLVAKELQMKWAARKAAAEPEALEPA
jgi:Cu(I)/Ag(I) efflux system membrane protein CusA/SilA